MSPADLVLLPVFVTGALGFGIWVTRTILKVSENQASTTSNLANIGDRVRRLEGWQDGVQFGRVVGKLEGSASGDSTTPG